MRDRIEEHGRLFGHLSLLVSIFVTHVAFAAIVPPPVAPATSTGSYTVTYSTNATRSWLQERVPGSPFWSNVSDLTSNGSVTFTGKAPGVYDYRTYWVTTTGGGGRAIRPEPIDLYSTPVSVNVVGPPIVLDDEFTQTQYAYEVRLGDTNGDGYTDIYIKRSDGNPDNGVVYESVAYQGTDGRFTVQPTNQGIISAARSFPVADVIVNGGDLDFDGYSDPTIVGFPAAANIEFPQTFLSSGQSYQRNARDVVATDASVEMFDRDMREARIDPNYFANAVLPDQQGYRIELVYEFGYCYYFFGFPVCVSDQITILIGEFSLADLGISGSSQSTGVQKLSNGTNSSAQSGLVAQQAQQKTASVVSASVSASLVGTSAEKTQSAAYFGISNPGPDTLVCVWLCGYLIVGDYNGYEFAYWYDVWTPITIPGEFDDVNYSQNAYDAHQGEVELLAALNALPGTQSVKDILGKATDQTDRMRRGWGIPNPFEIIIPPILEGVEDQYDKTIKAVRILIARWKIRKACKNAVDPEECIAAMEDNVIGETAEGEAIGGVWTPGQMEEESINDPDSEVRRQLATFATALALASAPGRWQCSYSKRNSSKRLTYYGITSTVATGNCTDAVDKRSLAHDSSPRFRFNLGFAKSQLDMPFRTGATLPGSLLIDRQVIRGREQQLIDSQFLFLPDGSRVYGIDARDYDKAASELFNRIRSVRKRNPYGCLMWEASNIAFGSKSPFTGIESFCLKI